MENKATAYIVSQINAGISAADITAQLKNAGWTDQAIEDAFNQVREQMQPTAPQTPDTATPPQLPPPPTRSRMKTGWKLFLQSMRTIRHNPQLIRYVIMTTLWSLGVIIVFAIIVMIDQANDKVLFYPVVDASGKDSLAPTFPGVITAIIVGYIINVITYFYGVGLASHVLGIFRGKEDTYRSHIATARRKLPTILTYSLISLVVGYILRLIERNRIIGFIVAKILGVIWALATTFVLPVIADSDENAGKSIKHSISLFKKTWGETITSRVSLGGFAFLLYLLIGVPVFILLLFVLGSTLGIIGAIIAIILYVIVGVMLSILVSLADTILTVSLYYYSQYGVIPPSFSPELLATAFVAKKKKK